MAKKTLGAGIRLNRSINPTAPLVEQFRKQRKHRGLTNEALARASGLALVTVARALGPSAGIMSDLLAQRLGHVLGFDAAHIAMVHQRDALRREEEAAERPSAERRLFEQLRRQIEARLPYQNPFHSQRSGLRLAFRYLRLAAQPRQPVRREVHLYERGFNNPPPGELEAWLLELGASQAELKRVAERLKLVHPMHETLARSHESQSAAPPYLYSPQGAELCIERSPTAFGAISIERIVATQPPLRGARSLRIVGAQHPGYELGFLLEGRLRLTLSTAPFPPEDLDVPYTKGAGVVYDEHHQAQGSEALLGFSSELYHRIEFLSERTRILTVNLHHSVYLTRGR